MVQVVQDAKRDPCWHVSQAALGTARVNSPGSMWRPHATQWMCPLPELLGVPLGPFPYSSLRCLLVSRFSVLAIGPRQYGSMRPNPLATSPAPSTAASGRMVIGPQCKPRLDGDHSPQ